VLNARTDAFLRAGDRPRDEVLDDALQRGRAFLDAGAPVVFVPGGVTEDEIGRLVEAFGRGRLSLLAVPRGVEPARMAALGVARVSFGPFSQSVTLMALQDLTTSVEDGGGLPADFRSLS
jgi:2-methylisocitrate lyase-like PEP mutase family enzyme